MKGGRGGESRLFPSSKNLIDKIIVNSSTKHPVVFLSDFFWELFEVREGKEGPQANSLGSPGNWGLQTALTHLGLGRWLETRQADGSWPLEPPDGGAGGQQGGGSLGLS